MLKLEEAGKNNDIPAIMKAIPTLGSYTTKGVQVRVPHEGEFSLAESNVNMSAFIGPIPTNVDITVRDLKLPVAKFDREPREVFTAMGFSDVACVPLRLRRAR